VWNLRHKEDVFANEYVRSTDALLPIKGETRPREREGEREVDHRCGEERKRTE
jgi:hypothetical protein